MHALDQGSADHGAAALATRFRARLEDVSRYVDAYRRYCWPVDKLTDLKLAPFHLLATEKAVQMRPGRSWTQTWACASAAHAASVQVGKFR